MQAEVIYDAVIVAAAVTWALVAVKWRRRHKRVPSRGPVHQSDALRSVQVPASDGQRIIRWATCTRTETNARIREPVGAFPMYSKPATPISCRRAAELLSDYLRMLAARDPNWQAVRAVRGDAQRFRHANLYGRVGLPIRRDIDALLQGKPTTDRRSGKRGDPVEIGVKVCRRLQLFRGRGGCPRGDRPVSGGKLQGDNRSACTAVLSAARREHAVARNSTQNPAFGRPAPRRQLVMGVALQGQLKCTPIWVPCRPPKLPAIKTLESGERRRDGRPVEVAPPVVASSCGSIRYRGRSPESNDKRYAIRGQPEHVTGSPGEAHCPRRNAIKPP